MDNSLFTTTDIGLAAYLVASGELLDGLKSSREKIVFCFMDSEQRSGLVTKYMSGEDLISASAFLRSYRHLKEQIFDYKGRQYDG